MTIAYDLRYACDHFAGIGTHAFALLEALLELPGDQRFLVLWDPSLRQTRFDLSHVARHPRVVFHQSRLDPLGVRGVLGLGRWLRAHRPSVYLSPFYLLPPAPGCPCVLTVHDVHPLRLRGEMGPKGRLLYRLSLARAARAAFIVTGSDFSRREIVELMRVPEERVRTTRLGVPPRPGSSVRRRPPGLPEGRYALVVGDNRPRKNLGVLAEAWVRLGSNAPLRLVWAGAPVERHETLPALAERLGARAVTGLGWMPPDQLAWLYAHADLVLFPSRYEGFGFPLLEAFASGSPALASDIPPLREIGEGVARFVPAEDAAGWAREVLRLSADDAARARMRDAGLVRASELTYALTARATLDVLHEAARP